MRGKPMIDRIRNINITNPLFFLKKTTKENGMETSQAVCVCECVKGLDGETIVRYIS